MNNAKSKPAASKKTTLLVILAIVGVIVIGAVLGFCIYKAFNPTYKIETEEDFIKCIEEGFPEKIDVTAVEIYLLENDITITKSDIKNPQMASYANKIAGGSLTEEKAREVVAYEYTMVFDGQGHTIKNLNLSGYGASLFGRVTGDGNVVVRNVTFENLTINGVGSVGALVSYLGENASATFENVRIVNSTITSCEEYPVGALIGESNGGRLTVKNCSIENSIVKAEAATYVGGLVGMMKNYTYHTSVLENLKNVSTEVRGLKNVGGIVGEYCDNYVDTLGIGGDEVDEDIIKFENLVSSGRIYASEGYAGGIMGTLSQGNDLNITFLGCKTEIGTDVNGVTNVFGLNNAGGIVGGTVYNRDGFVVATGSAIKFDSCENNQEIVGEHSVGGIIGSIDNKFWGVSFVNSKNLMNIYGGSKTGGIVGAIAGTIIGGEQFTFTDCINTRSVIGRGDASYVGGILGYNDNLNPLFTRCKSLDESRSMRIVGKSYVGGISGRYGSFVDCENGMNICCGDGVPVQLEYIGGIVGSGEGSTFTGCKNTGNVVNASDTSMYARYIGGIAGYTSQLVISGCSNSGNVAGSDCVGGLVGKSDATWGISPKNTLLNSRSTGNVYAFGQADASLENYTNDDPEDINGKIGLLIGYFGTGTLIFEFDGITAEGNIYILDDTDYVGGWCGYFIEGDVNTLKSAIKNSTLNYTVYFDSTSVSTTCISGIKLGSAIFAEDASDFNAPTEMFLY